MPRIPRVYLTDTWQIGDEVPIPANTRKHLMTVLRMQPGAAVELFNGDGNRYASTLQGTVKNLSAKVESTAPGPRPGEPITLGLGLSRGDRMDYAIQKCTELGVAEIQPLWTEHTTVKLARERLPKKMQHWVNIAVSASEQSGRCNIPGISTPKPLGEWLAASSPGFVLSPVANQPLSSMKEQRQNVLVGPESGLSDTEIDLAVTAGWEAASLGPLVLRTETAAVIAVALMQHNTGQL